MMVIIAIYYAAILAWSLRYVFFSVTRSWGSSPEPFFLKTFLQAGKPGFSIDFVPGILIPVVLIWVVLLFVLSKGVQKGIGRANIVFIPLLVVMFLGLVAYSLTLDGAGLGLDALFRPDWTRLADPHIWVAAYGQIFFSLSIGMGIMITYSSYLKDKTDLTGTGAVVGFSNASFELLAGIGVFAALGFMAQSAGVGVSDVATSGVGLAFVAFPTIISQAPGGAVIGLLFFGTLFFAGVTSMISVVEVIVAGIQDKFGLPRVKATLWVGIPLAVVSTVLMSNTSSMYILDILDSFVNQFGVLAAGLVSLIIVAYGIRALPVLAGHLNRSGSLKLGRIWIASLAVVTPVILGFSWFSSLIDLLQNPYGGYPASLLAVFGWGMSVLLLVAGVLLSRLPWSKRSRAALCPPAPPISRGREVPEPTRREP